MAFVLQGNAVKSEQVLQKGRSGPAYSLLLPILKYSSFTLKQTGWKYEGGHRIVIHGTTYKFSFSRPVEGDIKTVTVKRDNLGHGS